MAGLSLKVTIPDAAAFQRRLSPGSLLRDPVAELLRRAAEEGATAAREAGKGGSISSSIGFESGAESARVFSSLPQPLANVMEAGRRPGAQMPPPDVFGGGPEGFLIARAVGRRGIKGRFFMRKAKAHLRRIMPTLIEQASDDIEGRFK